MLISGNRKGIWLLPVFLCLLAAAYFLLLPLAEKDDLKPPSLCSGHHGKPSLFHFENPEQFSLLEQECSQHIPTLKIHTSIKDFLVLLKNRVLASRTGRILEEHKNPIPALLEFQGNTIKATIRLKGDLLDHIAFPMSLRIELKKEKQILGMNQFSLQKLSTRGNDIDPLFNGMMNEEGILAPGYRFVQVEVNGITWGLMEMEDYFSRELQESQRLKESLLGKFNENLIWNYETQFGTRGFYGNIYTTDFDFFETGKIRNNPKMFTDSVYAKSLIQGWQSGRLSAHHVFDFLTYLRFMVTSELWGAQHSLFWTNQRFYYNPYLGKFEPVNFDNSYAVKNPHILLSSSETLTKELILDDQYHPLFINSFTQEISRIGSNENLIRLETRRNQLINTLSLSGISSHVDIGLIQKNRDFFLENKIHSYTPEKPRKSTRNPMPVKENSPNLEPHGTNRLEALSRAVAYDNGSLEIINRIPHTITVKKISLLSSTTPETSVINPNQNIPPTRIFYRHHPYYISLQGEKPDIIEIEVEAPHNNQREKLVVENRLLYLDNDHFSRREADHLSFIQKQEYIRKNSDGTLHITPGNWSVSKSLVFPEGANVTIEAGTTLHFAPGTFMKTYGKLDIQGTRDNPVVLTSIDESKTWNGIFVVRAKEKSSWQWASINNTDFYREEHIQLTGAVTIYESDTEFFQVSFNNSAAEDMLNIVNSHFAMSEVTFSGGASDAFDSDFSQGSLANMQFSNIGGDGLDTSGSITSISHSTFSLIRDKAISIGEASSSDIQQVEIQQAGTAIAVKDYSRATIRNSSINQSVFADLMSYTKKESYGGALLIAENIRIDDRPVLIADPFSTLLFDQLRIANTNINIDKLYKSGPMQK